MKAATNVGFIAKSAARVHCLVGCMKMENKMTSLLLMITLLLTTACAFLNQQTGRAYQYGKKIDYSDQEVKKLPDISIRFLEKRREASPVFPRGFTYYDFEVMKGEEKKKISWSSGTGVIGPTYFEIAGEEYVLELAASKAHRGFMEEGEMVIWRKEEYDKLQRN